MGGVLGDGGERKQAEDDGQLGKVDEVHHRVDAPLAAQAQEVEHLHKGVEHEVHQGKGGQVRHLGGTSRDDGEGEQRAMIVAVVAEGGVDAGAHRCSIGANQVELQSS